MLISVVIPTYTETECLKKCLATLMEYTDWPELEIIVSANGASEATREVVKSFGPSVNLIWSKEPLGYSKACNRGMSIAKGEYIILLNDDVEFLPQAKNTWINQLLQPFKDDKDVGLSGPLIGWSDPADSKFIVFFIVMISANVVKWIGYLDESFGVGAGEDTDYCIRAMRAGFNLGCAAIGPTKSDDVHGQVIGNFPVYHKADTTVRKIPNWQQILDMNSRKLAEMYNRRWKLSNESERAVIGRDHPVPAREHTRYSWAVKNIVGTKILEIGCSSGYGLKYLKDIPGLDYLGIDYDAGIIEYAREQFGDLGKFEQADINTFKFEQYDTIIAFEIIEHLEKGKEIAQMLKEHCECLLMTTPYAEIPGLWGRHHKLHHLKKEDFPGFSYRYIKSTGELSSEPDQENGLALLLMKWGGEPLQVIEPVKEIDGITVVVPTRDRYFTTLPLTLAAVINQTRKPDKILIYEDGEYRDLRNDPVYRNIFMICDMKGIKWEFFQSPHVGQAECHSHSMADAKTKFIWRLDDDVVPEPDCLERLMAYMDEKIGAIGGCIYFTGQPIQEFPIGVSINKIKDISVAPNAQWFHHPEMDKIIEVDHLYSSFLYRVAAADPLYASGLSRIGHREETLLSFGIKRRGYRVAFLPGAVSWHLHEATGGIRGEKDQALWEGDEKVFAKLLNEWGVDTKVKKIIVLNNGLGDHLIFKSVYEKIKEKHGPLTIACCYPEVFEDDKDVTIISIADAARLVKNIEDYNIYGMMAISGWKQPMAEAYLKMYGE